MPTCRDKIYLMFVYTFLAKHKLIGMIIVNWVCSCNNPISHLPERAHAPTIGEFVEIYTVNEGLAIQSGCRSLYEENTVRCQTKEHNCKYSYLL